VTHRGDHDRVSALQVGRRSPGEHGGELAQLPRRGSVADDGEQRGRNLRLDQDLDRPFRRAAALDALAPHVTVSEGVQRHSHDLGLSAGPPDPAVQLAIPRDERTVADAGRGRPLDSDDRRERKRRPFLRETAGFDEDVHSARPASFSAVQTLSEVTGISMLRTPTWARASMTAFT
jgi:hypothetical protein